MNRVLARDRERRARELRQQRMAHARLLGTHTDEEWRDVCESVGRRCVRCGIPESRISNGKLAKDHIKPIYQGGSDGIENLQPLCHTCNSAKGPESVNWIEYRRENGFGDARE